MQFYSLIHHCGRVGPLTQTLNFLTQTLDPLPQTLDSLLQTLSSLPQSPAFIPQAHMTLVISAYLCTLSQYPPPHFTSTGGHPIDDSNGDFLNDPYVDDDGSSADDHVDDYGPFSAPLGNALDTLDGGDGGDINIHYDDEMQFRYAWHRAVSLDSPPKVVGHKHQYIISPSPPPIKKNAFIVPQKPQTPMYHSSEVFGSTCPGGQFPHKPSTFTSPPGMLRSRSSPSPTLSLLYVSLNYHISPTVSQTSQTSLSTKPLSSLSSRKKRTSVADMGNSLSVLNDDIQSMASDISERRELRNERYALKMSYQAQKRDLQWRHESLSQQVLILASAH
ncbi:hypothetical protein P692DRAFT_20870182 [Suillus brevipes Sb2]|nr:hypothetical protein P692DRAFT_20870182 [Suillus brevipes Sb2]